MTISKNDLRFVDIEKLNPRIAVDMRYATENNFMGRPVYPMPKCFLRRKVALKICAVHEWLEKKGRGLKILDAYRPLHVQRMLWEIMPDDRYVAPPEKGSKHNRGAAVDVTLVDEFGTELPMPTPFDSFSEKAHWACQDLPKDALVNRALLRTAMEQQGFQIYAYEWWHFDDAEWASYPIEDLSMEELCCLVC